jgi:class 3 adenylate cyclase
VDPTRSIQAILFTDIVDSTARAAGLGDRAWRGLLRRHHALVRRQLERFGGREVSTAGDGFLATFNQPAEAIHAACAIRDGVRDLGLEIRGGIHMGEVEWEEDNVGGIAVHIGARVAAAAGSGQILVSSTVRELMSGSGFGFEDRGGHALKGVPGEWRLFAVTSHPVADGRGPRRRLTRGSAILLGTLTFLMLFSLAGLYMGLHEKILKPGRDRFAGGPGATPDVPESTFAHRITQGSMPAQRVDSALTATPNGVDSLTRATSAAADSAARGALASVESQELPRPPDSPSTGKGTPEPPAEETGPAAERTSPPAPPAAGPRLDETAYKASERARAERTRGGLAAVKDSIRAERAGADPGLSAFASGKDLEQRALAAERRGDEEEALALFGRALTAYRAAEPLAAAATPPPGAPIRAPAPPPAPAPAPAAAEPTPESDSQIAQGVLAQMRHAIEVEDLGALQRAWVGLSSRDADNFRKWFKGVRDIEVHYQVRSVEHAGERIVASVQTTYEAFNESADRRDSQTFGQVLDMAERDGRWVVVGSRQ